MTEDTQAIDMNLSDAEKSLLISELSGYAYNQTALGATGEPQYQAGYQARANDALSAIASLQVSTIVSGKDRGTLIGALHNRIVNNREVAARAEAMGQPDIGAKWREHVAKMEKMYSLLVTGVAQAPATFSDQTLPGTRVPG